jgi:hypothetical protein
MTQIDKEEVERLARKNETRTQTRPHAPLMTISEPEPLGVETADTLRALRAALDAAETRERAAVAAKVQEMASQLWPHDWIPAANSTTNMMLYVAASNLRALSDTDALAEYVERVRTEERERCLNLVPDGSDEWYENLRPVHVKRMLAVLRAAIRQETNDG